MRKPLTLKVKATALCAGYDIEIQAKIKSKTLVGEDLAKVRRKLRQKLADGVASLPFAEIYPHEVEVL